MSTSLPSDEVAEDFKEALQDLKVNSKPEIDVLTVVAKENTTHAQAISRVLENHIKTTRPEWKLPSLYVLDSLIRHVGTPYSTYLGRNLFRTFMDTYSLVDGATRKEMEALLKSWKLPTPLSRDTRPVLPGEITRDIENALIKFRTVTFQQQQQQARYMRDRPGQMGPASVHGYRDNPGQTNMMQMQLSAGMNSNVNPAEMAQHMQSQPQRIGTPTLPFGQRIQTPPIRSPTTRAAFPVTQTPPQPQNNVAGYSTALVATATPHEVVTKPQLQNEVREILTSANLQKVFDPSDGRTSELIQTLETLRQILDSKEFDQRALESMKSELSKISKQVHSRLTGLLNPTGGLVPGVAPQTTSAASLLPPALPTTYSTMPPAQSTPLPLVPGPPNVPALPTPSTPVSALIGALKPQNSAPSNPAPSQSTTPQPSLLDQLKAAGLLQDAGVVLQPPTAAQKAGARRYGVTLDNESIKSRRVYLINNLYYANPDQCRQCGRRFHNNDVGKERKKKHMDWHFRVNSRVSDTSRNGIITRSPFLNELQWVKLKEHEDGVEETADDAAQNTGASGAMGSKRATEQSFVPAPTDAVTLNEPCTICMERFRSVWHAKTQQPVWMDAIKVRDKYYHASCYGEVRKGTAAQAIANGQIGQLDGMASRHGARSISDRHDTSARSTPDPVLGKRKFDGAS